MDSAKNHYSYRVYADPETAQSFDQLRFGSPIGEFIKQTQEQLVFTQLPDVAGWKVIDIGAGTGRLTVPFLEKGADITACDASEEMLKVLQAKTKSSRLQTKVVDAHDLPFPDNNFDCAISFRLLMHVIDWKMALAEFCRVSRDWVIIDFPARRGFLTVAPLFHWMKRPFTKKLQAYKVLPLREVKEHLRQQHFEIVSRDDGFFLPIFAHRMIRSTRFTRSAENLFRHLGLPQLFGSPVTIFARRIR
jgi:ubiquinone/menaquinone biosynthesis C-methylase UbiE